MLNADSIMIATIIVLIPLLAVVFAKLMWTMYEKSILSNTVASLRKDLTLITDKYAEQETSYSNMKDTLKASYGVKSDQRKVFVAMRMSWNEYYDICNVLKYAVTQSGTMDLDLIDRTIKSIGKIKALLGLVPPEGDKAIEFYKVTDGAAVGLVDAEMKVVGYISKHRYPGEVQC